MSLSLRHFESMFDASDDPWSFHSRHYEERKRAITLAALDRPRYRRVYEPGCANGALSAELAARCDSLVVSDGVSRAVALAKERLRALPHVRVELRETPRDWPEGTFDAIVVSELAYFLSFDDLIRLYALASRALEANGILLLCHWRPRIEGCDFTGDDVHAIFAETTDLHCQVSHVEPDFRLDVWTAETTSIGAREGLR